MSLEEYWRKRDFKLTPEPRGEAAPAGAQRTYVIQKHAARRPHYDFRLEMAGVLKSWAIPKGPSLDPTQKRLAVHVEDHPLDYGGFEGVIPARQYGAGTVMLWDRGVWISEGDPLAAYEKGHLKFRLQGEKLSGNWALVRMRGRGKTQQDNWLLIKGVDEDARSGADAEITEQQTRSVLSERSMDDIARRHTDSMPVPAVLDTDALDTDKHTRKPGQAEVLPDFVKPQLATLVDRLPADGEWLAELKYDGYRVLARVEGGAVQLWSRNRHDWTARMPTLAEALSALDVESAWLDGEVIALDKGGQISFQSLQNAFPKGGGCGKPVRLLYFLFDLLWLNGEDLRGLPQKERKARLAALLAELDGDSPLKYGEHVAQRHGEVYEHACLHGEEGLILKRADAAYSGERTENWLKLKCARRQEFVIGGFTDPKGSRHGFGALLLGVYDEGKFVYVGRVGTGFADDMLIRLGKQLSVLERKACPFDTPPTGEELAGVHWVDPSLVAEVRFAAWTGDKRLRHAVFLGLREDKAAQAIVKEQAVAPPSSSHAAAASDEKEGDADDRVAGVSISHSTRILFSDTGLTKAGLARYYEAVAPWLMPHLHDRPLSLMRCPRGPAYPCFFQKHMESTLPAGLTPLEIRQRDGPAQYMLANNLKAVIGLVQMGVVEFHTWGARRDRLDRPDRLIFDLDPGSDVPWARMVEAAKLMRSLLKELGFTCFLKTSGGKGLHVEVPLQRSHGWDFVKGFAQDVARHMADLFPDRFTANMARARRHKRIFIDYLRNGEGATAIAAFSVRARPGAPVAVPIAWEELADGITSNHFTVQNVLSRLTVQQHDPWQGYEAARKRITQATLKLIAA